ncbi:alpha/beta fold hydrolase [Flavobacterium sp.]|uniref:alpha/beta fold hydrolase n=1 Tax=Flavobacterium sp. TaxID=239 RepID=UPI003750A92F
MKKFLYKNTPIYYSDTGSGNAIVLLHGFLENSKMWNFYIPDFSIKNRIIAIDLLGHGQSECLGYIHSMENQAEMVFALLDYLKIEKAVFVGHSMGGYVALAFAEMYPVNIGSLVLLNSTSFEDNHERKINRNRAIKAVKLNYVNFVRMSISNLFSEENREILEDEIESVKLEALKTPLQGIVAAQEGMKIRKDRTHFLQTATFPILLILGEKDPVLNYQENIKLIEDTTIQLITFQDGHMSHIENKEDLKLILLDFFKQ